MIHYYPHQKVGAGIEIVLNIKFLNFNTETNRKANSLSVDLSYLYDSSHPSVLH
jgi:hypothetical protein